jgi:hypothetical protein
VVRYQVVEAGVAPDARRSGAYTVSHLPPQLRINEIIASNSNGPTDGAGQHDDWLEILNRGTEPVDLAGMFLSDDLSDSVQWALPSVVLDPEELVLVWCDNDPEQGPLHTTFNLSKGGGEIGLFDTVAAGNTLLHGFKFGPQNTDVGFGYPGDEGDAPEYLVPQTPGASNDGTAPFSTVVINEFFAGSQLPNHPDWIEVYNRGTSTANLSGWHLSDSVTDTTRYTFPAGTFLPPGDHLVVGALELGFSLGLGGEVLLLTGPDGELARDYFDYTQQFTDVSQGRFPDGTASWHFFSSPSHSLANDCDDGAPPLTAVTGLRFASRNTLVWNPAPDASAYDVVQGDLGILRSGGLTAAVLGCLAGNRPVPEAWVALAPGPGAGFFYLVRGVDFACGFGTWESGSASEEPGRDEALAQSADTCP